MLPTPPGGCPTAVVIMRLAALSFYSKKLDLTQQKYSAFD
jgi:hypothetical protein